MRVWRWKLDVSEHFYINSLFWRWPEKGEKLKIHIQQVFIIKIGFIKTEIWDTCSSSWINHFSWGFSGVPELLGFFWGAVVTWSIPPLPPFSPIKYGTIFEGRISWHFLAARDVLSTNLKSMNLFLNYKGLWLLNKYPDFDAIPAQPWWHWASPWWELLGISNTVVWYWLIYNTWLYIFEYSI